MIYKRGSIYHYSFVFKGRRYRASTRQGNSNVARQIESARRTQLAKGDEMARFNMGSTVILLFPPGAVRWDSKLKAGNTLRMGERIGTLREAFGVRHG